MNTKRYQAHQKMQKNNESSNEAARKAYFSSTGKEYPTRDDLIKHRLWQDQEHLCVYSGKNISLTELFTGQVEVDHILPRKNSWDDSYMNKVVCFAGENYFKLDRTPIDAFESDGEKWNQITQRIRKWDKKLSKKVDRFFQREADLLERDFIKSQLNDTRYIARLSLDYLKSIGADVSTTKGQITAWLRHQWGLNSLISEELKNEKNRTDHRHHAIDALVIACVNRNIHKQIKYFCETDVQKLIMKEPFQSFRTSTEKLLDQIIISHTPMRKLSGALHEETGLGMIKGGDGKVRPVARVDIKAITDAKKLNKVVDESLKKMLFDYVENECNGDYKVAFNSGKTFFHKDGKTPIYKLRVYKAQAEKEEKFLKNRLAIKDKTGKKFKFYTYGNNHHIEIFKHPESGLIKGRFITTALATQRARGVRMKKQPIIQQDYQDGYDFLMALHINDIVSVIKPNNGGGEGQRDFYRVQKLNGSANCIVLRHHLESTLNNKNKELYVTINKDLLGKYDLKKHKLNALGHLLE